jgi:hypothetical protein
MTPTRENHEKAMELAAKAMVAKRQGFLEHSLKLSKEAFHYEAIAVQHVPLDMQPTRAILIRSCATLAYDAGDLVAAEKYVALGLFEDSPDAIKTELRELYDNVNFGKHLQANGSELSESEFRITLDGPAVAYGLAPADEVMTRLVALENLLTRLRENQLHIPYREHGSPQRLVRETMPTYFEAPQAASYAITIRLGHPVRQEMMFDSGGDTISQFITYMEMFANSRVAELSEAISSMPYYRNFIANARKLVPDGKRIKTVGLSKSAPHGIRVLALRGMPSADWNVRRSEGTENRDIRINGVLCRADGASNDNTIGIKGDDGVMHKVHVPQGLEEIVRQLWYTRVIVTTAYENGASTLKEIDEDLQ